MAYKNKDSRDEDVPEDPKVKNKDNRDAEVPKDPKVKDKDSRNSTMEDNRKLDALRQAPAMASLLNSPALPDVLSMPSYDSASVTQAGRAARLAQANRAGRASTLLSDPAEQALGTEQRTPGRGAIPPTPGEQKASEEMRKKLIAMGFFGNPVPPTVAGG